MPFPSLLLEIGNHEIETAVPADMTAPRRVSVAVRPEHAHLAAPGETPALTGRLDNVVYFGTDTHYHVSLPSGGSFILRGLEHLELDVTYR